MTVDASPIAHLLAESSRGIITYFQNCDPAGKGVTIILLSLSFVAWSLMFGKWMELKRMQELNVSFDQILLKEPSILAADTLALEKFKGPYAALTKMAVRAFYRGSETSLDTAIRLGAVRNALQRGLSEANLILESKMVFLGSIVSGAPFLGLLGTVWGVMDVFGAIAESAQPATIQTLAPGVSGALLTTICGLIVAIPAVFGYNFLLTQTKLQATELDNFASNLHDRIELEAHQELERQGLITPARPS